MHLLINLKILKKEVAYFNQLILNKLKNEYKDFFGIQLINLILFNFYS